jgi:DNA-binding transcriptional LysR family regulator
VPPNEGASLMTRSCAKRAPCVNARRCTEIVQESTGVIDWGDIRYVLMLASHGSLARAAKEMKVDHTTVGRRVEAAERALGVRLFTRTTAGYVLTAEAEAVLSDMRGVESAVAALERGVHARTSTIEGVVRVTSPETFGCVYLAPRLTALSQKHASLTIELSSTGTILDLARREADVAVRHFRSKHASLVVRRAGSVAYGLYAGTDYLARRPLRRPSDLSNHALLTSKLGPNEVDAQWLHALSRGARPALVCELTLALLEACRAGAGVAVLPRYIGDREPGLQRVPMPNPPSEPIWITFHRDMRQTPRVRAVLDHLMACFERDAKLLAGK